MKKTLFFSILFFASLFFSCDERPIEIPDLSGGIRRVLVEEATGVACSQCPDGARTLTNLQSTFKAEGRQLIVVSVHAAGPFSVPYPASQYDFRSADAQALANFIGQLEGFPSSAVNRELLPNEISTFINPHTRWEGVIRGEFSEDYGLEVLIDNEYNVASRELKINVDVDALPGVLVEGNPFLTVLITQDSIVDLQNDSDVFVPGYVHRHVLRDVVSNAVGDPLTEPLTEGSTIRRTYSVVLPANWDEHHCSVVAFVHYGGTPSKEVLQAAEKYIIE
jgi:hypothetical protein